MTLTSIVNRVKIKLRRTLINFEHEQCILAALCVSVCVCDRVCCDTDNMLIGCIMEMKRKRIAISAEERNVYAVNE